MGGKTYVCKPTKASRIKYKKCIISAIRGTKITTRKGAQKAFHAAAKKCGVHLKGLKIRKGGRRKRRVMRGAGMRLPTGWRQRPVRGVSRRRMRMLPPGAEKFFG